MLHGCIRPIKGWRKVIYQVFKDYIRYPLGKSPPVVVLDYIISFLRHIWGIK